MCRFGCYQAGASSPFSEWVNYQKPVRSLLLIGVGLGYCLVSVLWWSSVSVISLSAGCFYASTVPSRFPFPVSMFCLIGDVYLSLAPNARFWAKFSSPFSYPNLDASWFCFQDPSFGLSQPIPLILEIIHLSCVVIYLVRFRSNRAPKAEIDPVNSAAAVTKSTYFSIMIII